MDIQTIPKIELHCHLEGIVDPGIISVLETRGIKPALSAEQFSRVYPVHSFETFIRWCHAQDHFEGDILNYTDIMDVHLARLKQQNVSSRPQPRRA